MVKVAGILTFMAFFACTKATAPAPRMPTEAASGPVRAVSPFGDCQRRTFGEAVEWRCRAFALSVTGADGALVREMAEKIAEGEIQATTWDIAGKTWPAYLYVFGHADYRHGVATQLDDKHGIACGDSEADRKNCRRAAQYLATQGLPRREPAAILGIKLRIPRDCRRAHDNDIQCDTGVRLSWQRGRSKDQQKVDLSEIDALANEAANAVGGRADIPDEEFACRVGGRRSMCRRFTVSYGGGELRGVQGTADTTHVLCSWFGPSVTWDIPPPCDQVLATP